MTPWHASTVHALITAGRDYLAERREDVAELIDLALDLLDAPVRMDLMVGAVSRLGAQVARDNASFEERLGGVEAQAYWAMKRHDLNDGGGRQLEDGVAAFDARLKAAEARLTALEAATDTYGSK